MALVTSFGLNVWLTRVARMQGWCDPVGDRLKIHHQPTPLVGGIGVMVAFSFVVLSMSAARGAESSAVLAVFGVGVLALGLGLWDDFRWKRLTVPFAKFGLQVAAASAMTLLLRWAGIRFAGAPVWLGWLLGMAYLVGAMNALNLEDGMDGLAGGQALLSSLGLVILFNRFHMGTPATASLALAGALAGFLVLNWHPARLFLGDGGSHLVGALLGTLVLIFINDRGAAAVLPAVLIIGLPVFDTVWVITRRLADQRNVVNGDRGHLYDVIYSALRARESLRESRIRTGLPVRCTQTGDSGAAPDCGRRTPANMSVPRTVLICWLIQAAFVGLGVLLAWLA
jgi:UDP-GlcNAc:undecaprenyl-phosphate GlcNAc-1-phosphate transferase